MSCQSLASRADKGRVGTGGFTDEISTSSSADARSSRRLEGSQAGDLVSLLALAESGGKLLFAVPRDSLLPFTDGVLSPLTTGVFPLTTGVLFSSTVGAALGEL